MIASRAVRACNRTEELRASINWESTRSYYMPGKQPTQFGVTVTNPAAMVARN
jgi:hypothetical protein